MAYVSATSSALVVSLGLKGHLAKVSILTLTSPLINVFIYHHISFTVCYISRIVYSLHLNIIYSSGLYTSQIYKIPYSNALYTAHLCVICCIVLYMLHCIVLCTAWYCILYIVVWFAALYGIV